MARLTIHIFTFLMVCIHHISSMPIDQASNSHEKSQAEIRASLITKDNFKDYYSALQKRQKKWPASLPSGQRSSVTLPSRPSDPTEPSDPIKPREPSEPSEGAGPGTRSGGEGGSAPSEGSGARGEGGEGKRAPREGRGEGTGEKGGQAARSKEGAGTDISFAPRAQISTQPGLQSKPTVRTKCAYKSTLASLPSRPMLGQFDIQRRPKWTSKGAPIIPQ